MILIATTLAYLIGSIPSGFLIAKFYANVDIRKIGSGNIGASNIGKIFGQKGFILVSFFDGILKGTVPIITLKILEHDIATQIIVSIFLVIGHNWSIFLKLKGGRGLSTAMGTFLGFWLVPQMISISVIAFLWGWYFRRNIAPWIMLSFIIAAILTIYNEAPLEFQIQTISIAIIIIIKRLVANQEPFPINQSKIKTLALRLILDRDISDHDQWVSVVGIK
jgi:glycerol-3-phosphate acyltransferase PlsY